MSTPNQRTSKKAIARQEARKEEKTFAELKRERERVETSQTHCKMKELYLGTHPRVPMRYFSSNSSYYANSLTYSSFFFSPFIQKKQMRTCTRHEIYSRCRVIVLISVTFGTLVVVLPIFMYNSPIYYEPSSTKTGPLQAPHYYLITAAAAASLLIQTINKLSRAARASRFPKYVCTPAEGEDPAVAQAILQDAIINESLAVSLFSVLVSFITLFFLMSKYGKML